MIVVAPVIWTTGVVVLTPLFTEMLADRYEFDLVPYYPLVLTAFLLLTSIIIVGGLASFLVLDEVDAGTLTVLRVTPVPLSTFFAYRAATVMVVTTVYVIATMSFSGILQPGLVPALIPIGLLAGLSAVVTLLLIVAVANNKIQGMAMVRALGMLIAGLPCLPWFIDSALEPRLRRAAAVLGGQGVLGRQRSRHLVAVPARRRRLQPGRRLAVVPPLPRQDRELAGCGQLLDPRAGESVDGAMRQTENAVDRSELRQNASIYEARTAVVAGTIRKDGAGTRANMRVPIWCCAEAFIGTSIGRDDDRSPTAGRYTRPSVGMADQRLVGVKIGRGMWVRR